MLFLNTEYGYYYLQFQKVKQYKTLPPKTVTCVLQWYCAFEEKKWDTISKNIGTAHNPTLHMTIYKRNARCFKK